jgi:hypothetical protein
MVALKVTLPLFCSLARALIPAEPTITAAPQLLARDNGANIIGYELDGVICDFAHSRIPKLSRAREREIVRSRLLFHLRNIGKLQVDHFLSNRH